MGEVALCPNCFQPTFPGLTFCHTCMAPVSAFAGWGPFERIWATAWIAWKATWCVGVQRWHAVTAWVFFWLSILFEGAWIYVWFAKDPDTGFLTLEGGRRWFEYVALTGGLLIFVLQLVLAWRVVRNVRRVEQGPDPLA